MNRLEIEHLCRSFGSLTVTNDVNLTVEPGERHVIIGPNGAGKTSLINQISGQLSPTSGRIRFRDVELTGKSPDRICQMGIARTFQKNNLFQNLSALENIRLAVQARRGNSLNFYTRVQPLDLLHSRAHELMQQVHLADNGRRIVHTLSYGEQRQLEIGVALASDPALLLLDEPTSGMSSTETQNMIALIRSLPKRLSVLMIEHDMDVVFSVADRVTVLYYGEVLVTASPSEVKANQQVREIYLGAGH